MKKILFVLAVLAGSCSYAQKNNNEAVLEATNQFLKTLNAEQKAQALFDLNSIERKNWYYTPVPRKGLDYRTLDPSQKKLAREILRASLSKEGNETALAIMQLESVLHVLENRPAGNDHRDPDKYYYSIFGTPNSTKPWACRIEGHHLSLNYSSADHKINSATPLFFGTNPARVPSGMPLPEGTEVLKKETAMGFDFLKSLNQSQHQRAKINDKAPYDMETANNAKAEIDLEVGLPFTEMNKTQQMALMQMVSHYVKRSPNGFALELLEKIEQAGLDKLHFVWMGGEEWGQGHYYRIHSPAILIEYDCTQNGANHVHSVIRDLSNDWGDDIIAKHIKEQHK
ncbi:MAG: DUF3500 domain-containing protein [Cytophagales bacterium]|nr:DUF3500 domain-containing protein [Cytophagales bacterium]